MRVLLPDGLPVSRPGVAIGGAGLGVAVAGEAQLGLGVEQVGQGDGARLVTIAIEAEDHAASLNGGEVAGEGLSGRLFGCLGVELTIAEREIVFGP